MRVTAKGLAKFMTAEPRVQRKILQDFKFPKPVGHAQAGYYQDALRVIRQLATGRISCERARYIATAVREAPARDRYRAVRQRSNARAIEEYAQHFGDRRFELLPRASLSIRHGLVVVSAVPDLIVRGRRRLELIKLEFSQDDVPERAHRILADVIFEASTSLGPRDVVVLDVPRGATIRGRRPGVRMRADILAACENIEAIWPTIRPRGENHPASPDTATAMTM